MVEGVFSLHTLPFLAGGVFMVALGAWLLFLDRRNPVNRALAVFLFLRGPLELTQGLQYADVQHALVIQGPAPFAVAVPFVTVLFGVTYARRYGGIKTHKALLPVLLLGALVAETVLFLDFDLWHNGATYGPLFIAYGLTYVCYAVLGLVFAWNYMRAEPGPLRQSLLLGALGFSLVPSFVGVSEFFLLDLSPHFVDLIAGADLWSIYGPYFMVGHYLSVISAIPVVVMVSMLVVHSIRTEERVLDAQVLRFTILLVTAAASAIAAGTYFLRSVDPDPLIFAEGVWTLALPIVLVYSLLRHQLFGVDITLKKGIERTAITGMFAIVFFVTSETVESYLPFQDFYASLAGAGVVSLVLAPVQRVAERFADEVLPGVKEVEDMGHQERVRFYRAQVEIAWADGELTDKDERMLEAAREHLGLAGDLASQVDAEVRQAREGDASGADEAAPTPTATPPT